MNMVLFSDSVMVPEEPVSKVPMGLAAAVETQSRPTARIAIGTKGSRKFREYIGNLLIKRRSGARAADSTTTWGAVKMKDIEPWYAKLCILSPRMGFATSW